ncbi:MAG: hypothetical protein IPF48_14120 [Sphingomonadales bacterium]|nr:hypothetical protein [Sphingomonadales bacterium]
MFACYAIFFPVIAAASAGSGHARFAIIISVLYAAVCFRVARIIARQAGPEDISPLDRGKMLDTFTGSMDKERRRTHLGRSDCAAAVALFGMAILVITTFDQDRRLGMRNVLPDGVEYAESPLFNEETVPKNSPRNMI